MVLKAEAGKPSAMFFMPNAGVGKVIQTQGAASLRIVARVVVDRNGNLLGDLEDTCEKARVAWEAEFKKAGLTF